MGDEKKEDEKKEDEKKEDEEKEDEKKEDEKKEDEKKDDEKKEDEKKEDEKKDDEKKDDDKKEDEKKDDEKKDDKDGKCHFPDLIFGGFKVKEGEHEGEKYATYMCHHRFVMTPNRDAFKGYMMEQKVTPQKAYMDLAHTAGCHEGKAYLPECEDHKKEDEKK